MQFPLSLRFKLIALAPQIYVTDASQRLVLYVKQKAFKLKEAITVFADEAQTTPLYRIQADRVIDFSATYHITTADGAALGSIGRKGMRSIWRAHFEVKGPGGAPKFVIREENPWVKVIDGLVGEIPVVGLLTGYLFHPAYRVSAGEGGPPVLRIVKEPAFLEGRYRIERLADVSEDDETLATLSLLMLTLLERDRG